MAGGLSKLFPRLFADPAQRAMERKQRITAALRRFDREVKKQDGFIRDYIQQAVGAKRTGDQASYQQVKRMIAFSFSYRQRAQRGYNTLRLFSTMADQMDAYRDFCSAMSDISVQIGEAFSFADMSKIQVQFAEGVGKAEAMQDMMDQLLEGFESSVGERLPDDLSKLGVKDADIDALVASMASEADTLTEEKVAQALSGLEAQK